MLWEWASVYLRHMHGGHTPSFVVPAKSKKEGVLESVKGIAYKMNNFNRVREALPTSMSGT